MSAGTEGHAAATQRQFKRGEALKKAANQRASLEHFALVQL